MVSQPSPKVDVSVGVAEGDLKEVSTEQKGREEASSPAFDAARKLPSLSDAVVPGSSTTAQWQSNVAVRPVLDSKKPTLSLEDANIPIVSHSSPTGHFFINCDNCQRSIPDEHYHCSICKNGDYDLCMNCVQSGISCPVKDHWLIKRFVKNGVVTNSITENHTPRRLQVKKEEEEKETPKTPSPRKPFSVWAPASSPKLQDVCNGCYTGKRCAVHAYKCLALTDMFLVDLSHCAGVVTCQDCWRRYNLCSLCLLKNKHGHHPGHTFQPVRGSSDFENLVSALCKPGRRHMHEALCDGCDQVSLQQKVVLT